MVWHWGTCGDSGSLFTNMYEEHHFSVTDLNFSFVFSF